MIMGLRTLISPLEGASSRFLAPSPFFFRVRPLCTTKRDEVYQQLEKLDFMTAAKILFTQTPKKKQFGFGFHLVQFISICMPSLAVYLVAQYARYEMRRMEAELEAKKKLAEEVEGAKEAEMGSDVVAAGSDSELSEVKMRLAALEETIKEIMDKSKKLPGSKLNHDSESRLKEKGSVADGESSKSEANGSKLASIGSGPENSLLDERKKQGSKTENDAGSKDVVKK